MPVLFFLIILVFTASSANAKCGKDQICQMANRMNPFAILDKCPMAGSLFLSVKTVLKS